MTTNELAARNDHMPAPFGAARGAGLPAIVNAGAVSIESERAIAEARGQMQLAKMFPRDSNAAYAELMEACKLKALASVAFYSVPRGNQKVTGPSIRLAEEIARVYGNFEYGHRELSRGDGKSEVEVYAWDKEKNNRSIRQITVEHTRDTREGPVKLRDQKDIDDKIANVASKQVRGRILALVPKWMVESAIEECRKTLNGDNTEPLSVRVRKMTQAFAAFGVNPGMMERYLNHKLDDTTSDELVDLTGVYNAIKDGAPASEYFGAALEEAAQSQTAETIKQAAAKGAATKATTKAAAPAQPDAKPEPEKAKPEPEKKAEAPAPGPAEAPAEAPAQAPEPAPAPAARKAAPTPAPAPAAEPPAPPNTDSADIF